MSTENRPGKFSLAKVFGPLAVGWQIYWSSCGIPGAARRLSSLVTEIEQAGGVSGFCKDCPL